MNHYFSTLQASRLGGKNPVTPMSETRDSSTIVSEAERTALSGVYLGSHYKPMVSGMLSPNPRTGKVRVDYDTETMSIVVVKDGAKTPFP